MGSVAPDLGIRKETPIGLMVIRPETEIEASAKADLRIASDLVIQMMISGTALARVTEH